MSGWKPIINSKLRYVGRTWFCILDKRISHVKHENKLTIREKIDNPIYLYEWNEPINSLRWKTEIEPLFKRRYEKYGRNSSGEHEVGSKSSNGPHEKSLEDVRSSHYSIAEVPGHLLPRTFWGSTVADFQWRCYEVDIFGHAFDSDQLKYLRYGYESPDSFSMPNGIGIRSTGREKANISNSLQLIEFLSDMNEGITDSHLENIEPSMMEDNQYVPENLRAGNMLKQLSAHCSIGVLERFFNRSKLLLYYQKRY
mmetsp:Transcript_669/g.818  ORF Transcript_669/g.818 Transcript_669/m.818 type:complete len:254 (-) Transcript_669:136-897(-)